jgi:SAM-dependent methyltransferase
MSGDRQRGWVDYWKADCAASCEPENPATARAIALLWQGWFAGFPDGTRILDVATGNGIVLAHAAAAARAQHRRFSLTGIDQADIDPPRYLRNLDPDLRTARFIGSVAAEALPFADGSFDLVASQYGLEYADLERALDEVARVLVNGGRLVWLAHSASSEIVRQHRRQAQELDFLLARDGPVAAMRRFVAALDARQDPRGAAARLNEDLAGAAEYCRTHAPATSVREILDGFAALVEHGQGRGAVALAAPLAEAERRLHAHRERILSLLDAALTPERLAPVRARLAAPPWTGLEITDVRAGDSLSAIGIRISAALSPAS